MFQLVARMGINVAQETTRSQVLHGRQNFQSVALGSQGVRFEITPSGAFVLVTKAT